MSFEEARAEYGRLRQAYDSRQLSPEEYGRRVQGLQVRDAAGTYWAIDGNSGGWLRYDGASWVPGQPPTAAPAAGAGGFGGPPQGNFGQPQGGFGQPQGQLQGQPQSQGSYNPQAGYNPTAAKPKRGNRGLLIGCGIVVVLLLLCVGGVAAALIAGGGSFSFSTTPGVIEAATARTVKDARPDQSATTFAPRESMYITYKINKAKVGDTLELRVFRNGARIPLTGGEHTLTNSGTIYGADSFVPTEAGSYRVEFYYAGESSPSYAGESSPSKTLDFTVQ